MPTPCTVVPRIIHCRPTVVPIPCSVVNHVIQPVLWCKYVVVWCLLFVLVYCGANSLQCFAIWNTFCTVVPISCCVVPFIFNNCTVVPITCSVVPYAIYPIPWCQYPVVWCLLFFNPGLWCQYLVVWCHMNYTLYSGASCIWNGTVVPVPYCFVHSIWHPRLSSHTVY